MKLGNPIACDRAFGRHLSECRWDSDLTGARDFNDRQARDKIFRGDNENPLSFLKHVARTVRDKKIRLPLIGYYRDVGFNYDTLNEVGKPTRGAATFEGSDKEYPYKYYYYQFNYQVLIMAAARTQIFEISMPLHGYLWEAPYFEVNYKFFTGDDDTPEGITAPLEARIIDPRMAGFNDLNANIPESLPQFFAVKAMYEVRCPILFMDKIEPVEEEVELLDISVI